MAVEYGLSVLEYAVDVLRGPQRRWSTHAP